MRVFHPNLLRGLLAGLFCLLTSTSTFSQSTLEPLYFLLEDTLWQWTETDGLEAVIVLPANMLSFRLSPTQPILVYERYTDAVLAECFDDQGNGLGCGGPGKFPTDIFALDLRTGETSRITDPPDPDSSEPGRSRPVWSPDGTRLAWTEGYDYASLHIHDFRSQETFRIAEDIVTRTTPGVSSTVDIAAWLDAGIVFLPEIVASDSGDVRTGYRVYDPGDGRLLLDAPPLASFTRGYFGRYGDTDMFFTDQEYLNLQTGAILPTPGGFLTYYAYDNPDTSLRIRPPVRDENDVYHYEIYAPDGELLSTLQDIGSFVFSSTGAAFAYPVADGIAVWRPTADGGPFEIALPQQPGGIQWGSRSGRWFEPGGKTFIAGARCEGSLLTFRLRRDDWGYVLGNTANNVRSAPNADGELVGQLAPGVSFKVVAGPVCAAGMAWWEIDNPSGWTAEGQGDTYWLQPGCPQAVCAYG